MERKRWYLVHAYGDYERKNPKSDVDGSLQVLAAAELWRRDRGATVKGFVFDCSVPYKDTTLAESMALQLRYLVPNIPEESVIVQPSATTTRGEVSKFKELIENNDITEVGSIGRPWHLERIGIAVQRVFGHSIPLLSSDQILRESSILLYDPIINKWNAQTKDGFEKREKLIQILNKIPFTNGLLVEVLDKILGNKKLEFAVAKILKK